MSADHAFCVKLIAGRCGASVPAAKSPIKFIEEAVKWRVLDQTMTEARSKFADMPPKELESIIDEAVAAARKAKRPKAR